MTPATTPINTVIDTASTVFVGKRSVVELLAVALLAEGHVLIEDLPGLGKTVLARALAAALGGTFRRIQFTPDMLPSDVTGYNVYDQHSGRFDFRPGPLMAHVVLADEINRTIPRTQSSLLESMAEGQLTIEGETYALPRPFFVIATQNPIELEGTFPLPEAQLDRFLMRVRIGYPDADEEQSILSRFQQDDPLAHVRAVTTPEAITEAQAGRAAIHVSDAIRDYVVRLVSATRTADAVRYGASPRASLALMRAAQARAALRTAEFVEPDDVKALAVPVLAHRLVLTSVERARGTAAEHIVAGITDTVPVP